MTINISDTIESQPLGKRQKTLLLLVCLAVIVDGFDLQMIAFVGPKLIEEWGLSKAELGQAISAGLIGMGVGAGIGGWMGDRFGRRLSTIFSVMFFGITTLPIAFVTDVDQLIALRFISGLGFGALFPNTTALLAEWFPSRLRGYGISLMILGVPLGGALGASVSSYLIATYSWQACFIAAGGLGILLGLLLWVSLEESPKYLAEHASSEKLAQTLNKAFGRDKFSRDDTFVVDELPSSSWSDVFKKDHRRVTFGMVLAFFANLLAYYGMANWIPTIVSSLGFGIDIATRSALFLNLSSIIGALVVPYMLLNYGSKKTLMIVLVGAILSVAAVTITIIEPKVDTILLIAALSFTGMFCGGLQVGLYTLASNAYPTNCRSTGIGVAAGVGRLGPIISGFGGAFILSMDGGNTIFFGAIVAVLVTAIIGVMIINRHTLPVKA